MKTKEVIATCTEHGSIPTEGSTSFAGVRWCTKCLIELLKNSNVRPLAWDIKDHDEEEVSP